jgi:hypothetical protein
MESSSGPWKGISAILSRHPGENRGPESTKWLDSGFRQNDKTAKVAHLPF